MKYCILILFSSILLMLIASAAESDLNIKVESIKERQNVYASVTDIFGLDLFTSKSAEIEKQHRDIINARRQLMISELYAESDIDIISDSDKILEKTNRLGLFKTAFDPQVNYRRSAEIESSSYNPIIVGIAVLSLCALGFFFSRTRYKRNKERGKNVYNSNR